MAKTMTTAEFGKMLHAWKREKEDNAFAFEERKHLRTLTRQLKSIPTTREGKVELRREMKKIIWVFLVVALCACSRGTKSANSTESETKSETKSVTVRERMRMDGARNI